MAEYTPEAVFTKAGDLDAAGFSVFPVGEDKIPAVKWAECMERRLSPAKGFGWDRRGIGIATGPVSSLLVLDFDGDKIALWAEWLECARASIPDFDLRVPLIHTPSGGRHAYLKTTNEQWRNAKLAMQSCGKRVIFETRGKGGYVVTPGGHPSCHPTGKPYFEYTDLLDEWGSIETLDDDEVETLLNAARLFDERVTAAPQADAEGGWSSTSARPVSSFVRGRPGDAYEQETEWATILGGHGWEHVRTDREGVEYWRRPGKDRGWSGTVNYGGFDKFRSFSSSMDGIHPDRFYSRFGYYLTTEHGGDVLAAVTALRKDGLGFAPTFDHVALEAALGAQEWEPFDLEGAKAQWPELRDTLREASRQKEGTTAAKLGAWAAREKIPLCTLGGILVSLEIFEAEQVKMAAGAAAAIHENPKATGKALVTEAASPSTVPKPQSEEDHGSSEAMQEVSWAVLRKVFHSKLIAVEAHGTEDGSLSVFRYSDGAEVRVRDFQSMAWVRKAHRAKVPPVMISPYKAKDWEFVADHLAIVRTVASTAEEALRDALGDVLATHRAREHPSLDTREEPDAIAATAAGFNHALAAGLPVALTGEGGVCVAFSLSWAKTHLKDAVPAAALEAVLRAVSVGEGKTRISEAAPDGTAGEKWRMLFVVPAQDLRYDHTSVVE